jgi:hypothetical protein
MSVEDFFQGGFEEHSDAGDESEVLNWIHIVEGFLLDIYAYVYS